MKWQMGRQGTGYYKFMLVPKRISALLKFDMLLMKMGKGAYVPPHIDPIHKDLCDLGYKSHHRLNIILSKPKKGGIFYTVDHGIRKLIYNRINYFNPCHAEHGVTPIEEGSRFVFSIGWISRKEIKSANKCHNC